MTFSGYSFVSKMIFFFLPKLSIIFTQTHTHTGFHFLWGLSIGVMVFILYKPHFLSPYTNPTPKPTPYRKLSAISDCQYTPFCVIYKLVSSWGPKKCPHKVKIYWYYYTCGDIWSPQCDKYQVHTHYPSV